MKRLWGVNNFTPQETSPDRQLKNLLVRACFVRHEQLLTLSHIVCAEQDCAYLPAKGFVAAPAGPGISKKTALLRAGSGCTRKKDNVRAGSALVCWSSILLKIHTDVAASASTAA